MNTDTIRMRKFFNRITVAVLAVIVSLLCTACNTNAGGGGAPGNNTVSYTQVSFAELGNYLTTKASESTVNYIEVTGLTKENVRGTARTASILGEILKAHPSKKVALKFGGKIEGLTSMGSCFDGCETLVQVSGIPEGVTNMGSCFYGCTNLRQAPVIPESVEAIYFCFSHCTNLKQAPVIPANVTDMYNCFLDCENLQNVVLKCNYNPARDSSNKPYFEDAFDGCTALTAGGIKVPAGQLAMYQTNADVMGVTADKFAAE